MYREATAIPVLAGTLGSWHLTLSRQPLPRNGLSQAYDQQAAGWQETLDRLDYAPAYTHLMHAALGPSDAAPKGPTTQVLDAGIGTAAMSLALRQHWSHRFCLTGVDLSPSMLSTAARCLQGRDIESRLEVADITALPCADASMDMVLAAHVFEHLPDPLAGMAECLRVLKPGGRLICALTRRSLLGALIQLRWRTHSARPPTVLRWLGEAGFSAARALPFAPGTPAARRSIGYTAIKPDS